MQIKLADTRRSMLLVATLFICLLACNAEAKPMAPLAVSGGADAPLFQIPLLLDETQTTTLQDKCSLCVLVLDAVAKLAMLPATQEAIITYVEGICTYLPQDLQTQCNSIAAFGTPALIDFLIKKKGPNVLCEDLRLCNTTNATASAVFSHSSRQLFDDNDDKCVICEYIVSTLAGLLANQAIEDQFLAQVSAACAYLPEADQQPCHDLISGYGSSAIAVILQYATPGFTCTQMTLCTDAQ